MSHYRNFQQDIVKSKATPLLLEINSKDLQHFCSELELQTCDQKTQTAMALETARHLYDKEIKGSTNVIYVDSDKSIDTNLLLDAILNNVSDDIKKRANFEVLKEIAKFGISNVVGSAFGSVFEETLESQIEGLMDFAGSSITDVLSSSVPVGYGADDYFLDTVNDKVTATIADPAATEAVNSMRTKIHLTPEAKSELLSIVNSLQSSKNLTVIESLRTIAKIMLSVSIGAPKIIAIKNPHRLDEDSIAIISLLLSISKDIKNKDAHSGISFIYSYSDEQFQPYQECPEAYKNKQALLDDQRRFAQRYAMLERPGSDIPTIAVKQSMFVGRDDELSELKKKYEEFASQQSATLHQVIVADAGYGKTALINKHIASIAIDQSNQDTKKRLISLKLLNQVGHSSATVGLSSLKESIIKQANKLQLQKSMGEKLQDKAKQTAKEGTASFIKKMLGVESVVDIANSVKDRSQVDDKLHNIQHMDSAQKEEKSAKEKEFDLLDGALYQLK